MSNEQDHDLVKQIRNIKLLKPTEPGDYNCIDFALGDTGVGTRHLIVFEDEGWRISTTACKIDPDEFIVIPVGQWSDLLIRAASLNTNEILRCFDVDEDSCQAALGDVLITLRFRENPKVVH